MSRKRTVYFAIWCALLIVVAIIGYSRIRRSGLNGTWVKKNGVTDLPGEMTLRATSNQFKMSYFDAGGVESVTLLCDQREHPLTAAGGAKISYRAELDKNTLVVTKHIESSYGPDATSVERWSLDEHGRRLVVSSLGKETVFERPSWLQLLLTGSP